MDIIQDLPEGKHNVVVLLSGGADSSIVYYAVCNKFKNRNDINVIVLTLDTDYKDQYVTGAKRIIEIVGKLTGKYPIEHITDKIPHNNTTYVTHQNVLIRKAKHKYGLITKQYSGLSLNPPVDDMYKFFEENYKKFNLDLEIVKRYLYNARDESRDNFKEKDWNNFDISGMPFLKLDKKSSAAAYNYYRMMNKLYPYTFSCEQPPYKFDKNGLPIHCGYCFFCLERWYAFGRII